MSGTGGKQGWMGCVCRTAGLKAYLRTHCTGMCDALLSSRAAIAVESFLPAAAATNQQPCFCARALLLPPADDLQHMRVMERRFIIWSPTDAPEAGGARQQQQQQQQQQQGESPARQQQQEQQQEQQAEGGGACSSGSGSAEDGGSGQQGGAWDQGLAGIWREFTARLEVRGAAATC